MNEAVPAEAGAPSGGAGSPEEQPQWRVKVYRLNEDGQWDDCGTGSVALARGSAPTILVMSESEQRGSRDTLLASRLVPSHDAYTKQGENIITWDTRRGDGGSVRFAARGVGVWSGRREVCRGQTRFRRRAGAERGFRSSSSERRPSVCGSGAEGGSVLSFFRA